MWSTSETAANPTCSANRGRKGHRRSRRRAAARSGALFGGNCLLVGVPRTAQTLLISTLARILSLRFSASSSHPTSCPPISPAPRSSRRSRAGLRSSNSSADRSSPTSSSPTKSTAHPLKPRRPSSRPCRAPGHRGGQPPLKLPDPFFVLATQNPIEQEGTYPLPEAQLDRFMLNIFVDYPSEEEESASSSGPPPPPVPAAPQSSPAPRSSTRQDIVRRIPARPTPTNTPSASARTTRPNRGDDTPDFIRDYVSWGPAPAPASTSCSPPRRAPSSTAAPSVGVEDIRRRARPSSATASSPTSTPRPTASKPTTSSTA